jgi:metallo-beta-lactamase class B
MKKNALRLIVVLVFTIISSCKNEKENTIVYESETLLIEQITPTVFKHKSYLQTQSFGKVGCNGMVYITNNEALVFDTPTNGEVSKELINWIINERKTSVSGVVVNHFHEDCLGGLKAFHNKSIRSYASNKTIELARKDNVAIPTNGFETTLELQLGNHKVITQFFGEAHTVDNTVSYVKDEKVLFGGCMIKSLKAGKGNLADANVNEWSNTVSKVKKTFPKIKTVIPGHGKIGNTALLDYTIKMFQNY